MYDAHGYACKSKTIVHALGKQGERYFSCIETAYQNNVQNVQLQRHHGNSSKTLRAHIHVCLYMCVGDRDEIGSPKFTFPLLFFKFKKKKNFFQEK